MLDTMDFLLIDYAGHNQHYYSNVIIIFIFIYVHESQTLEKQRHRGYPEIWYIPLTDAETYISMKANIAVNHESR